jgi:hypothetical protein
MIFDYLKNKHTELTPTIILAAKKDLSSWLETIEAGHAVAVAILENQVIGFFFLSLPTQSSHNPGSPKEMYQMQ